MYVCMYTGSKDCLGGVLLPSFDQQLRREARWMMDQPSALYESTQTLAYMLWYICGEMNMVGSLFPPSRSNIRAFIPEML